MQVFTFASTKDANVSGFTFDKTGTNLPAEWGPWTPMGSAVLTGAGAASTDALEPVLQAITQFGFYVARAEN